MNFLFQTFQWLVDFSLSQAHPMYATWGNERLHEGKFLTWKTVIWRLNKQNKIEFQESNTDLFTWKKIFGQTKYDIVEKC